MKGGVVSAVIERGPGFEPGPLKYKSPVMAVMSPTIVMAATSAPPVMMTATAAMTPSVATTMSMAAPDLNDTVVRRAESIRGRDDHCEGGHGWGKC
jgi:hypothetical protein